MPNYGGLSVAIRVFETDPEAAPKPRQFADDLVGRFRSGYQINGRPAALTEWRVTTGDPEVADEVRSLLGGDKPQPWDTKGEDNLEVFTEAGSVEIIIERPKSLRSEMVLWGRNGAIRRCDGISQHGEGDEGKDCECPQSFADRKDAARSGKGCQPSITLFFKLREAPDLGVFKFTSGSWSLVRDLGPVEAKLAEIDGPAYATLRLEQVEWEVKETGAKRSFTKPVIEVTGAVPAASRDEDDEPPF